MNLQQNIKKESDSVRQRSVWNFFCSYGRNIIFTGTFNTLIGVSSFNKIPVPAFPCRYNRKSLNAFYHACSYAKADYSRFMNVTAKIALHLIPEQLKSQLGFLCIDDTMISKFGTKFENVSKLFEHAAHNGCNYLNGHCFVSLMLCVPM